MAAHARRVTNQCEDKALSSGLAEVTLWGDGWPVDIDRHAGAAQYRLSAAAHAFKVKALTAPAIPHDCVESTADLPLVTGNDSSRPPSTRR
jgi:hypothetical protein